MVDVRVGARLPHQRRAWALAGALVAGLGAAALGGCDRDPTVEVGTGELTFEPIEPGSALEVIYGAQGGQHVWIAIHATNMEPDGFEVELAMFDAGTGEPISLGLAFEVSLAPAGDGHAVIAGLPFFLFDLAAIPSGPVRVDITCTDVDGRVAEASITVVVAP